MKMQNFIAGVFLGILAGASLPAAPNVKALWVWTDELSSAGDRATLVQRAAGNGITDLYVSVFQSNQDPNSKRNMYPDYEMADLIAQASKSKIKVWATYGASDWPAFGCAAQSTVSPLSEMTDVVAYNKANSKATFAGVILDVEFDPQVPPTTADFQALLSLYQCIRQRLPNSLRLAVAINAFWVSSVPFPAAGPCSSILSI